MRILSLFWHNILPDSISPSNLDGSNSTASLFREQIRFILDKYTPISIADFVGITTNRDLLRSYIKPPVLLGFDDGFKNVLSQALPILNEFKIPAVFFVIGELLRNPEFVPWFVEFKHLLRKTEKRKINYDHLTIDLSSREGHLGLGRLFEVSFKACCSEPDRQKLLANLADSLNVARPRASDLDEDLRFVTKEELSALPSTSSLTVASHAMTHRHLDSLTYDEQVFELEQSDALLRQHCPAYYPIISYPGGSFSADTITVAKRIYKAGFAVFLGSSYRNRYAYPRVGINYASVRDLTHIISPNRLNYMLPLKRFLHVTGLGRIM
jgi:peptidoglycan/xylan/chitin deacetylase (PgdA/CDA1 family)